MYVVIRNYNLKRLQPGLQPFATLKNKISTILYTQNIIFDLENQHIQCLTYIINLAIQKSLESFNISKLNNENSLENDKEIEIKLTNIIYKVSLYFYYFKSF